MPDALDRTAETVKSEGFVESLRTGQPAAGEFHCCRCGYGVIVQVALPRCPMCSGTAWEQPAWGAARGRPSEWRQ